MCMRMGVHEMKRGGVYLYYMDFGGIPTPQRDGREYKFVKVLFSSRVGVLSSAKFKGSILWVIIFRTWVK